MRKAYFKNFRINALLWGAICLSLMGAYEDAKAVEISGTHIDQALAKQVTIYAGPETIPPNAYMYIDVEVHREDGQSLANGRSVTLIEENARSDKKWTQMTEYGLARFVIPSGQKSGDRVFKAYIDGQVSKPVAVFVTSGHILNFRARADYDAVSDSLVIGTQAIKDQFGNGVEDGTLITLTTHTLSGEISIISAPLIRGRARWSLLCQRYSAGFKTLTLTVKNTRETLKVRSQTCAQQAWPVQGGA